MLGGRYRVLARIGSGGMAEVFRARDEVLERDVAVKVFRAEHVAHDDAHGLERQQLEVAALARLNHPNLIALYDGSIGDDQHAYIVMELIDGPPLSARIAAGPLPEASVREIGIQLADGLAYVHSQGMVHRDVKPENILLGVDRSDDDSTVRARLSDFGIVRLLGSERLTSVNFTLGTASYLAPEQARGSDVSPPADIYSLGLVLLEALTGQRAFTGAPLEAAMARLSQRPAIPADLPEPWPRLLYAMTEFDPALRPSASEVARVLRNEGSRSMPLVPLAVPVAAGFADAPTGMVAAVPASSAAPDARAHRHRPSGMLVAAVASLMVIAATLGIFLFTGNDSKSPASTPTQGRSTSAAAKQARSDHSKGASSGGNQPAPGRSSSPSSSSSKSGPSSSSSSAPATHSSAPRTSTAPSTSSAPRTSTPATTSPAAPSTPATSAAATSPGSTGSSPAGSTSTGTTGASSSQSPNSQTTTPAG